MSKASEDTFYIFPQFREDHTVTHADCSEKQCVNDAPLYQRASTPRKTNHVVAILNNIPRAWKIWRGEENFRDVRLGE